MPKAAMCARARRGRSTSASSLTRSPLTDDSAKIETHPGSHGQPAGHGAASLARLVHRGSAISTRPSRRRSGK